MTDLLIEGLKVAGLFLAGLLAFGLVWATVLGLWQAITGESKRRENALSKAWIDGWNAAQRGAAEDAAEWSRRMDRELDR